MVKVIVEMDDAQNLQIGSAAPPELALAVITAAYHELLSQKVQRDMVAARQRIGIVDGRALRGLPRAPGDNGC